MKKHMSTLMALLLTGVTTSATLPVGAAENYGDSLNTVVTVPNGGQLVSVEVQNENIRTVLHDLAQQGGFNLMMDESVAGNITTQMSRVSINQALQSIADMNGLIITKQPGNIFLIIGRQAASDKGISRQLSKVIKIYYSNASRIANTLNQSIFSDTTAGASGTGPGRVQPDNRTNSIIVVGTQREIELAETAVSKMDIPRQSKTFYLSHSNALDVATILASSIFNDGTANISLGNSSGGGSSGPRPTQLRVERQDLQEGSGINNFGGSSGSGSLSAVSLRGSIKVQDTMSVSPDGPMVVPDSRANSVTVMGTAEQIALAESMIPRLDAQTPQVAIEASLVEISQQGVKQLGPQWGVEINRLQYGFNNDNGLGLITNDPTDANASARSGIVLSSPDPLGPSRRDFVLELRSLVQNQKAKILANPTVVAAHDTESIISIVDEIVRRVTVTIDPNGFSTQQVEVGEAGIVLDVLPKIGEDGTINLRLRPSVTSVRLVTQDASGNIITLLNRRDLYTQNVRVRDGETLVIGGLVNEEDHIRNDKMPGMGDLPIIGAMFRASSNGSAANPNKKSELVMMITPHIMNNTKLTPVNTVETGMLTGGGQ